MRLVHTLVSSVGYHDPAANSRRLASIDRLLEAVAGERPDLLVLPGGFLTVSAEREVHGAVDAVAARASRHGVVVIGGVDANGQSKSAGKGTADTGRLPWFGFATTVAQPVWRQTSERRDDAWSVPAEDVPGVGRLIPIVGEQVGVLVCGELYSEPARQALAGLRPDVVVVLGHESMKRVTRTMRTLADEVGCGVAHTHHLRNRGGQGLHYFDARGQQQSRPLWGCNQLRDGEFWIGWTVREIG